MNLDDAINWRFALADGLSKPASDLSMHNVDHRRASFTVAVECAKGRIGRCLDKQFNDHKFGVRGHGLLMQVTDNLNKTVKPLHDRTVCEWIAAFERKNVFAALNHITPAIPFICCTRSGLGFTVEQYPEQAIVFSPACLPLRPDHGWRQPR